MDDESYMIKNGQKMDAGGRRDKEDIIHELQKHFKVKFDFLYSALWMKSDSPAITFFNVQQSHFSKRI